MALATEVAFMSHCAALERPQAHFVLPSGYRLQGRTPAFQTFPALCAAQLCQQHPGQVKFYTISCPELTHKTFKQARKAFPNATLVGMVDAATGEYTTGE
eukprot:1158384-Pelagomonas_calceolata.AAC.9